MHGCITLRMPPPLKLLITREVRAVHLPEARLVRSRRSPGLVRPWHLLAGRTPGRPKGGPL